MAQGDSAVVLPDEQAAAAAVTRVKLDMRATAGLSKVGELELTAAAATHPEPPGQAVHLVGANADMCLLAKAVALTLLAVPLKIDGSIGDGRSGRTAAGADREGQPHQQHSDRHGLDPVSRHVGHHA